MRACIVAIAVVGASVLTGAASGQAGQSGKRAFEAMCAEVSEKDKLPAPAIAPFCSCLADKAVSGGDAVYKELWAAAEQQPDPDKRLAALTASAKQAVQSCRASPAP